MIMLIELKNLIQQKCVVKEAALARELDVEQTLLNQMLTQLVNMGYILKMPENTALQCPGCTDCDTSDDVVYCWQPPLKPAKHA